MGFEGAFGVGVGDGCLWSGVWFWGGGWGLGVGGLGGGVFDGCGWG